MEQAKQGMPKWLKVTGIVLIVVVAIGMFGGDDETKSTASESASSAPVENAMRVDATEIVNAYIKNEVAADNQYKGKKMIVAGTIADIGKDIMDDAYITIHATSDELRAVQCTFADPQQVASLSKGQQIAVKGVCKGLMMNVLVDDCVLAN
ncbi:OB-fold protein [Polluticoccus soli]|uniref:OB-fold protein n=1 Tax=Polluticoccus soli TaxID=3034150 RepID=UPI0023E247D9|nr:hypothetical protein [Flavipsychrobacter sp. JY13-12]